jgi:hypothetical protein
LINCQAHGQFFSLRRIVTVLVILSLAPFAAADDNGLVATMPPATEANLTGNWDGWRDQLVADGFSPFGNWTGEIWDNADGGIRTGLTHSPPCSGGNYAIWAQESIWPYKQSCLQWRTLAVEPMSFRLLSMPPKFNEKTTS